MQANGYGGVSLSWLKNGGAQKAPGTESENQWTTWNDLSFAVVL